MLIKIYKIHYIDMKIKKLSFIIFIKIFSKTLLLNLCKYKI